MDEKGMKALHALLVDETNKKIFCNLILEVDLPSFLLLFFI